MQLEARIAIKKTTISDLFCCYKPKRVWGYCTECINYGKNYSCPIFDFDEKTLLQKYQNVYLIFTLLPAKALAKHIRLYPNAYDSDIYQRYAKGDDLSFDKQDTIKRMSMYAFETVKNIITARLLDLEKAHDNSYSLIPGSCTNCKVCKKVLKQPCAYPERLRYSLEAMGFLVSDILKNFFNYTLSWNEDVLKSDMVTLSAWLSNEDYDIDYLQRVLGFVYVKV